MQKVGSLDHLPGDLYAEALDALHVITGVVLFEFAREPRDVRDTIIRNFIARADTLSQSIFTLWSAQDYQDCWILHRCLVDRFFHLVSLSANDEFELFESWSFLAQFKAVNRVLNDPLVDAATLSDATRPSDEQMQRARELADSPPRWRRPRAEQVAKDLDMRFLYRFGYDFGSAHVHPMANDGLQDFHTITHLEPAPVFPDQRTVLSNTLLIMTLIIQQGLNASTPTWRALLYDTVDDLRRFLGTGKRDYATRLLTLAAEFKKGTRMSGPPAVGHDDAAPQ